MNKPAGFVCTRHDPHASDTIFDLLPPKFSSLFYVGRLDVSSEGLLLLTNDGEFAQRLAHPHFHIEKEYDVTLDKPASNDLGLRLIRGVVLDGKLATVAQVRQISRTRLRVVLEQGINRQIRRMLERFGFQAKRLRRVRIGGLELDDLPVGKWRQLGPNEVRSLNMRARSAAKKPAR
jgi:pseudouridine synthase